MNSTPLTSAPSQAGPKLLKLEKPKLDEILGKYIVELSQTEWAVPILFISKNSETLRLCVVCLKLNFVTERNSYPIPHSYECIASLGEAPFLLCITVVANNGQ